MGELCRAVRLSRSTIYQYLRLGILPPPIKKSPTQLRYSEAHLKRINNIRRLREHEKISIAEIQEMFQTKPPEGKPEEDTGENIRDLIVEKALELFSKSGFFRVKITDITEALNLGKGTFYLYFKSKDELILQCIKRVPEIILPSNRWEEIRQEKNYFKRIRKRLQFMNESFPGFAGIISIAKVALRGDDSDLAKKATECFLTIDQALIKDLDRAINVQVVREIDKDLISFVMFGIGETIGYWLKMNPGYNIDKCIDKVMDFISYGLMPRVAKAKDSNDSDYTIEVNDLCGNKILLRNLNFDQKTYFEGSVGKGYLQIDLERCATIQIKQTEDGYNATVTTQTLKKITIQIDEQVMLSGESSFGSYTTPITNVTNVVMRSSNLPKI